MPAAVWLAAVGLSLDARGCLRKPAELACPNHLPLQRIATHSERHLLEGCGHAQAPKTRCPTPEGLLQLCCPVEAPAVSPPGDTAPSFEPSLASASTLAAADEEGVGGLLRLPAEEWPYGVDPPPFPSPDGTAPLFESSLDSASMLAPAAGDAAGIGWLGLPPALGPTPSSAPSPPPGGDYSHPPPSGDYHPPPVPPMDGEMPAHPHRRRLNKPPSTPPSVPPSPTPAGTTLPSAAGSTVPSAAGFTVLTTAGATPLTTNGATMLNAAEASITEAPPPTPPLRAPLTAPVPGSLGPALSTIAIQVDMGFAIVALALAIACAGVSHLFGRALQELCRRRKPLSSLALSRRRMEAEARLREAHLALSASAPSVPDWQRAVVAIGARPAGGGAPTLVGSGFVVHLPSGGLDNVLLSHAGGKQLPDGHAISDGRLISDGRAISDGHAISAGRAISDGREAGAIICTCAHVLDDIRMHARRRADSGEAGRGGENNGEAGRRGDNGEINTNNAAGPEGSAVAAGTRGALLDPYTESVAVGWGSPVVWRYAGVVRRVSPPPAPRDARNGLDLALLELLHPIPYAPGPAASLSSGTASPFFPTQTSPPHLAKATLAQATPLSPAAPFPLAPLRTLAPLRPRCRSLPSFEDLEGGSSPSSRSDAPSQAVEQEEENLMALPLGDDLRLRLGDDLFLLGYSRTARNQPPAATNTRGVFAGRWDDDATGQWLRTDALMLGGHSGGPLINTVGEVVGWSVRSNFDPVVQGAGFYAAGLNEVRPVRALKAEIQALLGPDAMLEGSVRCRLAGPAAAREAMRAVEAALSLHAGVSSDDDDRPPLRLPRRFPRRLHASSKQATPSPSSSSFSSSPAVARAKGAFCKGGGKADSRPRLDWRAAPNLDPLRPRRLFSRSALLDPAAPQSHAQQTQGQQQARGQHSHSHAPQSHAPQSRAFPSHAPRPYSPRASAQHPNAAHAPPHAPPHGTPHGGGVRHAPPHAAPAPADEPPMAPSRSKRATPGQMYRV
jgi:hypothetical protein